MKIIILCLISAENVVRKSAEKSWMIKEIEVEFIKRLEMEVNKIQSNKLERKGHSCFFADFVFKTSRKKGLQASLNLICKVRECGGGGLKVRQPLRQPTSWLIRNLLKIWFKYIKTNVLLDLKKKHSRHSSRNPNVQYWQRQSSNLVTAPESL